MFIVISCSRFQLAEIALETNRERHDCYPDNGAGQNAEERLLPVG